jgi:two-component system LytT family response regulator
MHLNVGIIDDEQHARENLRMLIEEYCPSLKVVGTAADVASGLLMIDEVDPEIVFLDIRMPSGSEGFELLRQRGEREFLVVFVTAFKDYAIDAFKVNAVDYLLKPIDIDELVQTVERLAARMQGLNADKGSAEAYSQDLMRLSEEMLVRAKRISIHHQQGVKLIRTDDISFLQAEGNCTRLVFNDGSQYLDTRTLKVYEALLDKLQFMRVHRSNIINLNELEEFVRKDGNFVKLRSGHSVPVARNTVAELLSRMESL